MTSSGAKTKVECGCLVHNYKPSHIQQYQICFWVQTACWQYHVHNFAVQSAVGGVQSASPTKLGVEIEEVQTIFHNSDIFEWISKFELWTEHETAHNSTKFCKKNVQGTCPCAAFIFWNFLKFLLEVPNSNPCIDEAKFVLWWGRPLVESGRQIVPPSVQHVALRSENPLVI